MGQAMPISLRDSCPECGARTELSPGVGSIVCAGCGKGLHKTGYAGLAILSAVMWLIDRMIFTSTDNRLLKTVFVLIGIATQLVLYRWLIRWRAEVSRGEA